MNFLKRYKREIKGEVKNDQIINYHNIFGLQKLVELSLFVVQYEISAERTVKIVGKDAIKKVLGKSPDLADALCYANWSKTNFNVSDYCFPICGGA